jgi:hypothetical protein
LRALLLSGLGTRASIGRNQSVPPARILSTAVLPGDAFAVATGHVSPDHSQISVPVTYCAHHGFQHCAVPT